VASLYRLGFILALPSLIVYTALLIGPLALVLSQSLIPMASQGAGAGLSNYTPFLSPAYVWYFVDTFGLSLVACLVVMTIAYPLSQWLVNGTSGRLRGFVVVLIVLSIFVSGSVKVYGVALALGPTGLRSELAALFGARPSARSVTSLVVVIGLINFLLPVAVLGCIAPVQRLPRSLNLAAQSLGASRLSTHLKILLPLLARGLLQVFLLIYVSSVSAFIIPWILGRGQINFLSNLIYARFSEVADFGGGAALSIVLLAVAAAALLGVTLLARRTEGGARL